MNNFLSLSLSLSFTYTRAFFSSFPCVHAHSYKSTLIFFYTQMNYCFTLPSHAHTFSSLSRILSLLYIHICSPLLFRFMFVCVKVCTHVHTLSFLLLFFSLSRIYMHFSNILFQSSDFLVQVTNSKFPADNLQNICKLSRKMSSTVFF